MTAFLRAWSQYQFELFVAALCMFVGLPLALGVAPAPTSIAATLPDWTLFFWGASLSLGGACTVTGILWRAYNRLQFVAGLLVEKAGMHLLGASSVVLALAIGVYAGDIGILTSGIFGALFCACVSRIRTINKEVAVVREHGEGQ